VASKGSFLRDAIYNAIFRGIAFQGPAQLYFSMHTGAPGLNGANEVAGNAYARVAFAMGAPNVGSGASVATIAFPAPAPAIWGDLTHWGMWDSPVGGQFYGGDLLNAVVHTSVGVPVAFPTGNITWSET
jgi:hypothetical protein